MGKVYKEMIDNKQLTRYNKDDLYKMVYVLEIVVKNFAKISFDMSLKA